MEVDKRLNKEITTVSVIGAGDMGHGIAQAALLSGLKVYLIDINEDTLNHGVNKIKVSMDKLYSKNLIGDKELMYFNENLQPSLNYETAIPNSDVIIEAVPEILKLKQDVFKKIESFARR